MFSKKITNDDSSVTKSESSSWFMNGWKIYSDKNSGKYRQMMAWNNAYKSLYKKLRLAELGLLVVGLVSTITICSIGAARADEYRENDLQLMRLSVVHYYASDALPLFKEYTSANPPHPITANTVSAINNVAEYLVLFGYINSLDDTSIVVNSFNLWVDKYREWPETDDTNSLQTKNRYVETINSLVVQLQPQSNPEIPSSSNKDMLWFAESLESINMNVYANKQWYQDAINMQIYGFIPLGIFLIADLGILIWALISRAKWNRAHPLDSLSSQEDKPTPTVEESKIK